ncbi:hypothetical protein [Frankia sp. Cj3]|uniref:hypothetical protein n=1 Tax=Frankia sp. Cj3 TaxID=2880976 RepID=UPI001EF5C1EF|nr:hypothetical protein [Frankia sp. Cj3]
MPTASDHDHDHSVVPAGRPATVWPCQPATPDRRPAGWLQAAVERLVAICTRPGDPVLLLDPPSPAEAGPPTAAGDDTTGGFTETGWAVARLGRPVQVRTAPADPAPRPAVSGPGPDPAFGPGPDTDRHTLVVTVVAPTRFGWFTHIPWSQLVAPGGTLAVITRSDSVAGWLIDPTIELTTAAWYGGLTLLDRIVLMEVPLDQLDQLDQLPTPIPTGMLARRVHSDLLLFTTVSAPVPPGGEGW